MNHKFIPFSKKADLVITDATQRCNIITAALAVAVANMLHLPTSEVENPTSHFNLQLMPQVNITLSLWNENVIFDVKECVNLVRTVWLVRYTAAHPLSRPMYSANYDFFDTVIGVSTFVSADTMAFLDGPCKAAILDLAMEAINTILNMKE